MTYLRRSKIILCAPLIILACTTSPYKITGQAYNRTELTVAPDRVMARCEDISGDFEYHMFLMMVLDDANSVVLVIQPNNLDEESCMERVRATEKILKSGRQITISGMG